MLPSEGLTQPLDEAALRRLTSDGRVWCAIGVVRAPTGEEHYEIDGEDIMVDVELAPNREQVFCRLGASAAGAPGCGLWCIPPLGAEVLVALPQGQVDGTPVIVAVLSTGKAPAGVDGAGTVVLVVKPGAKVLIHDGTSGDAKALATKEDVDNHTHDLESMQVVTSAAAGTWDVTRKPPVAGVPATKKPAAITGTQVLKAK